MPDNQDSSSAGSRAALDSCGRAGEPASDEPDQPNGALAAVCESAGSAWRRLLDRLAPHTPTFRFLSYVRPHLWLVAGGSVMGVLKFGLPLAFPLAFTSPPLRIFVLKRMTLGSCRLLDRGPLRSFL